MPTLKALVDEKSHRLQSIPDAFETAVERQNRKLLSEVIELMGGLDTKEGLIVNNAKNLSLSTQIGDRIGRVMMGGEYARAVESYLSQWNKQERLNNDIFSKTFSLEEKEIYQKLFRQSQENALAIFGDVAVSQQMTQPIKRMLTSSVSTSVSFTDAIKELTEFIIGNDNIDGSMTKYVKMHARNIFTGADANYVKAISNDLGLSWFRYAGGFLSKTRLFCAERAGKYFHKSEIEQWGAGNVSAGLGFASKAGFPWRGMASGTNSGNIFTVRGGYNCIHWYLPVVTEEVPIEVRKRIIK